MDTTIRTNSNGFTLLEILIAMFIFVVVLSTIFTSYNGTFRIVDVTESQADIYAMARVALERMCEDLESVYFSKKAQASGSEEGKLQETRFLGEDKDIKDRAADTLRFVSTAHLVLEEEDSETGIAEIVYHVKETDEGAGLVLYRADTPALEQAPGKVGDGVILCDELFSVSFTFYDAEGEAHKSWDSAAEEFKYGLPAMVSILLEFVNSSDPEAPFKFMTSVSLPMARDDYGKAP